ncbi:MAG TPA: ImmA/IrrE family metallo-endopeptidase [Stellaceae bacterium]|jgi:Zn-dependent peptidase ImmA (M78 family)
MIPDFPFRVIAEYQKILPVDVEKLARRLGLSIRRGDLEDGVYGKLSQNYGDSYASGYTIYVNRNDARIRQRFTIAHEIAHYILHRDLIGSQVVDREMYRSNLASIYETQANRLAADILMPAALVEDEFRNYRDIALLARRFDVSAAAMEIRLHSLGLNPELPASETSQASR